MLISLRSVLILLLTSIGPRHFPAHISSEWVFFLLAQNNRSKPSCCFEDIRAKERKTAGSRVLLWLASSFRAARAAVQTCRLPGGHVPALSQPLHRTSPRRTSLHRSPPHRTSQHSHVGLGALGTGSSAGSVPQECRT